MSRPKNKEEYRQELAEMFSHVLEEKGLEWRKEWNRVGGNAPYNGVTKAHYRGSNAFYLSLISMIKGYNDPRWVTMVQIMDKDRKYHPKEKWHLKKGSKAAYVEYWYPFDIQAKKALTWTQYKDELANGRNDKEFTLLTKYTPVFNAHNVEGMPKIEAVQNTDISADELIQKLCDGMNIEILTDGGDEAYYSPTQDKIHLPIPEAFNSEYAFNATALHELSHSTGHPTRLNRSQSTFFGTSEYAYEELVAEMCSCFMGTELVMQPTKEHINNHKAYVQSWIKSIREKPETLIKAIKDAQAAANYMDWKAGLITEIEYQKAIGTVMKVKKEPQTNENSETAAEEAKTSETAVFSSKDMLTDLKEKKASLESVILKMQDEFFASQNENPSDFEKFKSDCQKQIALLSEIETQIADTKSQIGVPFAKAEELKTKSARLTQLNAELDVSGKNDDLGGLEQNDNFQTPKIKR